MYFSIQAVKHVSSPFESEAPGLGTQRSKQCSFNFWASLVRIVKRVEAEMRNCYLDEHARILHGSFLLHLAHDLRFWVAGGEVHCEMCVCVIYSI